MVWTRLVAAATLAACGASTAPPPAPPKPQRPPVKGGPIPRVMVPAELGDPGALERIGWRARRARAGTIYLAIGGTALDTYEAVYDYDEWPVIAEAGRLVQIVDDLTSARIAVWIPRADLITVVREDIAVGASPDAVPDPVHHATIRAGAKVERGTTSVGATELYLDDPDLAISGWVPSAVVGEVYRFAEPPAYKDQFSIRPDTAIRAAPDEAAPLLATAVRAVAALGHPGAPAGWKEITAYTDRAVVRGFVRASAIDPQLVGAYGAGHGAGYGVGGGTWMQVAAGTCLFAAPEGEVVGVQLRDAQYMIDREGGPAWWQVKLMSELASLELYVRDTAETGDPSRAQLESCTTP